MSHMIQHHISVNHESSYLRVMQSDMKRVLFFVDKFFFCTRFEKFFLFQAHGILLYSRGAPLNWITDCITNSTERS